LKEVCKLENEKYIENILDLDVKNRCVHDERVRSYILPKKIILKTEGEAHWMGFRNYCMDF
jgi:hypothetical protein